MKARRAVARDGARKNGYFLPSESLGKKCTTRSNVVDYDFIAGCCIKYCKPETHLGSNTVPESPLFLMFSLKKVINYGVLDTVD